MAEEDDKTKGEKRKKETETVLLVGGAGLLGLFLLTTLNGGSTQATTQTQGSTSQSVDPTAVSAAASEYQAQLGYQGQVLAASSGLQAAAINAIPQIQANEGNLSLAQLQTNANQTLGLAQIASNDATTRSNNSTAIQEAALGLQGQEAQIKAQLDAQVAALNEQLGIAQTQSNTSISLGAQTTDAQKTLAQYEAQTQQEIAALQSQTSLGISGNQTTAQVNASNNSASTQKTQSTDNLIGNVASGLLGFFGKIF